MGLFGYTDPIQRYRELVCIQWADETPLDEVRFVVLDTETTGTDPRKDSLISIGAVVVQGGQILLDDQFEVIVKFFHNTPSVMVHGVTREIAQSEGVEETEALIQLLSFVGNGVIVGHHIGFDVEVIQRACQRRFGLDFSNRWLDTMELTLHLQDMGGLPEEKDAKGPDFSLDGLCRRFRIPPHDRHTAAGDAFITAQIFLKLLRIAKRCGRDTLGAVSERYPVGDAS